MAGALSLDTICNSALFFAGKWEVTLKRNQSRDVLRAILNRLYGASKGSLFHARIKCSHAALAANLGLTREWTCKLIARLRQAGWIITEAPRLTGSQQQDITLFRPGRMLKRLLVMLLRSRQHHSRVNHSLQKTPSKEQTERGKAFFAELVEKLVKTKGIKT